MNNKQVAHLWANNSRPSAKGSNFYFEGDTIYSYGSHFPIARRVNDKSGNVVILFTTRTYSNTTARHKSIVRSAVSHLPVYHMEDPTQEPSTEDARGYGKSIASMMVLMGRGRSPESHLAALQAEVIEANGFCGRFGIKMRFSMPSEEKLAKVRERIAKQSERAIKWAKKKLEQEARETKDAVEVWMAGLPLLPGQSNLLMRASKAYLRMHGWSHKETIKGQTGKMVQTSKGAIVPLDDVKRGFRFAQAMRSVGWRAEREELPFSVGDYHIDSVNGAGVVAGCHRFDWEEIERFAKLQGWI